MLGCSSGTEPPSGPYKRLDIFGATYHGQTLLRVLKEHLDRTSVCSHKNSIRIDNEVGNLRIKRRVADNPQSDRERWARQNGVG